MMVCGYFAVAMLAEQLRDWWHYKETERGRLKAALVFGGLFVGWMAYGMCKAEEDRASKVDSRRHQRELFLEKRRREREAANLEALKQKPFANQRYGCLKFMGYAALAVFLAGLYLIRQD
jgi:hypothetical protein